MNNMMLIKDLVEKIVDYTRTWSISENEWYSNVCCDRISKEYNSEKSKDTHLTDEEFERAIREEILYDLIYNIDNIKIQMENDLQVGFDEEMFLKDSINLEKEIQKYYAYFKIKRY